jgi:hypothetical protein
MTPDPDCKPGGDARSNENAQNIPFTEVLERDEVLLWQGSVGFTFASSPIAALVVWIFAGYVYWSIWGSYTLKEFCPPADHVHSCGKFYVMIPPLVILMAAVVCFEVSERWAIASGRAQAAVLLTSRRLIRASNWPWRRIRAYDYRANPPRLQFGNILRFGKSGSIFLRRSDVDFVFRAISRNRASQA